MPRQPRALRWWIVALSALGVALVGMAFAASMALGFREWWNQPSIYRAQGTVSAVRYTTDDGVRVCLVHAYKAAGSTYGPGLHDGHICMSGIPSPSAAPRVGDCVILQEQGESSSLKIERSAGCP